MVVCELCGKTVDKTTNVIVAGTKMQACNKCKNMGKVIKNDGVSNTSRVFVKTKKENIVLDVVPNYVSIINSALAKRGINLHQLARVLNIKESTLNKYFLGKLKPDVETAKRLERYFEVNLLEEVEEVNVEDFVGDSDESVEEENLSLGDLLKKKLKEGK